MLQSTETVVAFESPRRLPASLRALAALAPDRPAAGLPRADQASRGGRPRHPRRPRQAVPRRRQGGDRRRHRGLAASGRSAPDTAFAVDALRRLVQSGARPARRSERRRRADGHEAERALPRADRPRAAALSARPGCRLPALGRGVIVAAGSRPPAGLGRRRADRGRRRRARTGRGAATVDRLHACWVGARARRRLARRRPGASSASRRRSRRPALRPRRPTSTCRSTASITSSGPTTTTPAPARPIWWWGEKAARLGATVGGVADVVLPDGATPGSTAGRAGAPPATEACASIESGAVEAGIARAGAARARRPRRPSSRPTSSPPSATTAGRSGSSLPPARARPGCSTERMRHLLADRGYRREAVIAVAYNKLAQNELETRLAGARAADPDAELARLLAPQSPPRHPGAGPQRARGARPDRAGLPDPAAAAHQHRSGRPLPRRADRRPARARAAGGGRGDARRRPRVRRRLRRLPRGARRPRRDRLRRADLRRARGAAARRRVPPPRPARAPPPARRRVPGSDPRARADDPAARDAGVRRLRSRRRRPDDLRPRRRRPAVPRRLRATSSPVPSSRRSRSTTAARRRSSTAPRSCSATTASGFRRRSGPRPGADASGDALELRTHPSSEAAATLVELVRGWLSDPEVGPDGRRRADPRQLAAAGAAGRAVHGRRAGRLGGPRRRPRADRAWPRRWPGCASPSIRRT